MDDGIIEMADSLTDIEILQALAGSVDRFPKPATDVDADKIQASEARWLQVIKAIAIKRGLQAPK